VKYDRIAVVAINAIKEQQAEIESLKNQVAALDSLRQEVAALKALLCTRKKNADICPQIGELCLRLILSIVIFGAFCISALAQTTTFTYQGKIVQHRFRRRRTTISSSGSGMP
jgi:hypothetical protein